MKTTMPMLCRADASFVPRTYDEEARTIEMVWTKGAKVRRRDWMEGDYDEELVVSEEAIDMGRLNSGAAPLLAAHNSESLDNVLGVVESAWIMGPNGRKEGRCKVRFSKRAEVEPILADVRDGILRNVSVGYRVLTWEKRQPKGDEVPTMRAIRWEPMEVSLVPMGADAGAHVRAGQGAFETEIITTEDDEMTRQTADTEGSAAADPVVETEVTMTEVAQETTEERAAPVVETRAAAEVDPREVAQAAIREERERCNGIALTCRKLRLDPKHGEDLIARGVPLDQARAKLIDLAAVQERDTQVTNVQVVRDEAEVRGRALTDALLWRVNPGKHKLTEAARENGYQHFRLIDAAREVLEANGIRTRGLPPMKIAQLALEPGHTRMSGGLHSTSDFANILSSTINTTLRQAYNDAPATFRAWARQSTAPDYRAINRVQLSSAPRLSQVNEHGEYTRGTMTDSKESYQVVKYGKVIGITREIIVNDYMDAFGRVPMAMAAAAASLESDIVYSVLLANAAMADGTALFHANHGNLGSAAVINVTSIGEAFALLAKQANANGSPMNLMPRYLLVPPEIRPAAEQLVNTTVVPETTTNGVPAYMRGLQVVQEARLTTGVTVGATTYSGDNNGWFVLADNAQIDTVEYAYLEGEEGVYTETRNGFDVDGVEVKVRLDFGAKAIDWRGMVKNAGA